MKLEKGITQPWEKALIFWKNSVKNASCFQFLMKSLVLFNLRKLLLDEVSFYLRKIFEH